MKEELLLPLMDAGKIFLQWETIMAQERIFLQRNSEKVNVVLLGIGDPLKEIEGEKETKGKIEAFLNENHIDPPNK